MSLSPIKLEILGIMLLNEKPMKIAEVAKEAQKEPKMVRMHILGLIRMRYVVAPEKGQYKITEKGRQALGVPETNKEKAEAILAYEPHDKAFHFYCDVGKPLSLHAHNLRDFANKLEKADLVSVEFHMKRGDFEVWFKGLGDEELAKKISLLNQRNITGEELRRLLREIVMQRYIVLATLAGQPVYAE